MTIYGPIMCVYVVLMLSMRVVSYVNEYHLLPQRHSTAKYLWHWKMCLNSMGRRSEMKTRFRLRARVEVC